MNLLHDIFISRIYAMWKKKKEEEEEEEKNEEACWLDGARANNAGQDHWAISRLSQ